MSTPAKAWTVGLVLLAVVLSFFVGRSTESGVEYSLDIYDGTVKYTIPLQRVNSIPNILCDVGTNRVVVSLNSVSRTRAETPYRGTTFCGSATIQSDRLRTSI